MYCLLFLFLSSISFCAEVIFYATDISMAQRKEFGINTSFLVHVIVKKVSGNIEVQVPELMRYGARRTGVQINTINGITTVKHTYSITIDKEGIFSFGKAHIIASNAEYFSSELEVVVTKNVNSSNIAHQQSGHSTHGAVCLHEPKAVLHLDIQNPYCYQEVHGSLFFYYDPRIPVIRIYEFAFPSNDAYRIDNFVKAKEGTSEINQTTYAFIRFDFILTPLESGRMVIPSFILEYDYPPQGQSFQNIWSQFAHFFTQNKHSIRIPSYEIYVQDVPLYQQKAVAAVGQFHSYKAILSPTVVTEDEGVTLALELVGKGNMQIIKHPSLNGIDGFTYYQSQVVIDSVGTDKRKVFEYVLQPNQSGALDIPPQTIITFDPVAQEHRIFSTHLQTVLVKPSSHQLVKNVSSFDDGLDTSISQAGCGEAGLILDIPIVGIDFISYPFVLNSFIFFLLFLLPASIFIAFLLHHGKFLYIRASNIFLYYTAFYRARTKLKEAEKNNNSCLIYGIFLSLIRSRFLQYETDDSYFFLYRLLHKQNIALEGDDWQGFVVRIAEQHFVHRVHNSRQLNISLFNQAFWWIDELQRRGL